MRRVVWFGLWALLGGAARADDVDVLIRTGNWTEALPAATAAAEARPSDLDAQERLIDVMLTMGQPSEAVTRFKERALAHPDDPDAWYLLGRATVDAEESRSSYRRALEIDPKHARSHMGLASILRATGDLRAAAGEYQAALALDPTLSEAWGGMIAAVLPTGDAEAIRAVALAATQSAPGTPEGWLTLAAWWPEKAGEALRKGAAATPDDPRLQAALAEQLLREGDGAGALSAAKKAIALDPTSSSARLALLYGRSMATGAIDAAGFLALEEARRNESKGPDYAIPTYAALITKYPRSALPLLRRAIFMSPRDPAASRADLVSALRLDPNNDEVMAALGLAWREAGDHAQAVPMLEKAARARPDDPSIVIALARSLADLNRLPEAEDTITRAAQRDPFDPVVAMTQAEIIQRTGNPVRAADILKEAWARTGDVRVFFAFGVASQQAGNLQDAAVVFEELFKLTGRKDLQEMAAQVRAQIAARGH